MLADLIQRLKTWTEKTFSLYTPTVRRYMTTYYFDVERRGKLTGEYQHRAGFSEEWVSGRYDMKER